MIHIQTLVIKRMVELRNTFNCTDLIQLKQKKFLFKVANYLKKIVLILALILIFSCQEKIKEIRYYPNNILFSNENTEVIGLDTTKLNFKQITNKIGTFDEGYGKLVVEFDDGNMKKRIIPFAYGSGLIKERNILEITSDSILIDNGYSISELKRILKRHYTNKGEIPYYSETPYNTLVEVTVDTSSSGKELKEDLIRLTRTFDEIKNEVQDTIKLYVYFDYLRQTLRPPPPPKKE